MVYKYNKPESYVTVSLEEKEIVTIFLMFYDSHKYKMLWVHAGHFVRFRES